MWGKESPFSRTKREESESSAQGHPHKARWRKALSRHPGAPLAERAPVPPPLTTGLDLAHIVAGEPASPAAERAFPPAPVLHSSDVDDVSFREGKLVFIGLLEVKLCSYYQLIAAIVGHVLEGGRGRKMPSGTVCITTGRTVASPLPRSGSDGHGHRKPPESPGP